MAGIAPNVVGLPGMRTAFTAIARVVFRQVDFMGSLAGGRIIDGTKTSDATNTGDTDRLQAGLLMGKITTGGLYANSVIGVTGLLITGSSTTSVTGNLAATVTELVRRQGASGTFTITGPSTANGTIHTETVTYSAASGTTITISTTTNTYVAGSFICPTDGSQNPITLIPDGFPVIVSDASGTRISVPFAMLPIAGVIESENIINWPTDTTLQNWIRTNLSTASGGKFVWSDTY